MAELIWNNEAECGLLSCLKQWPQLIDYVSTLVDDDTFHGFNKYLYLLFVRMNDEGIGIEKLSVKIEIDEERGLSDEDKLVFDEIFDYIPIPSFYEQYLNTLKEKRIRNAIAENCSNFITECFQKKAKANVILEDLSILIKEARGFLNKKDEIRKVGSISDEIKDELDTRTEEVRFKVKTGLKTIDNLIPSLEPNDVFIIAARPSYGKTSLLIDILMHIAFWQKVKCGFFSLEMPTKAIVFRMIQSLSYTNIQDHFNKPTNESWKKIAAAVNILIENNNIYIDDTAGLDIGDFRAKCGIMAERGVEVVGVDYLQLMTSSVKSNQNRENELSYISSEIKATAKEFKLRIIVCAQLNRKPEQRKGKRPMISDLRESGSIEQDADIIGLLSKDNDEHNKIINCMLHIGKNRNGPTGNCKLAFVKHLSKFTNPFYGIVNKS